MITETNLDGGYGALEKRVLVETDLRPQKHYLSRLFRALKMAFTKTRLLKHDLPIHGLTLPNQKST